jgi:hypothetical protein
MLSAKAASLEDENRRLKGKLAILERRVEEIGA